MNSQLGTMVSPEGWEESTMGKIGRYLNGFAFSSKTWSRVGRPIIRIQNLTGSGTEYNYFDGEVEDRYVVREGDLLFSWAATLGVYIWHGPEAVLNQHIFKVESNIDKSFHRSLIEHKTAEMMQQTHGTGMVHITKKKFDAIPILKPPIEEQEKIVQILEEQLSHLDAALASVRLVREKAARFRRSLLHAAFSGALSGHEFPPGQLPDGWSKSTIGDVADVFGGRTPTKFEQRLNSSESPNRNVPFYKVGDMNSSLRYLSESRVYFSESEASDFGIEILKSGTIIFPKAGGAIATNKKRILEVPGAIDLNCMGLTAKGGLQGKLLYWFFESFNLSSIADGSVLPQINKKRVLSLEICYPISKDDQVKLLDEIEAEISKSEAVVQVTDAVEKKVLALRRSLLHAAFTGNLTKEWRERAHV